MAIFLLKFLDYSLFFSEILTSNKVALASSIKHFRVDVQKTATSITTSRSMSALAQTRLLTSVGRRGLIKIDDVGEEFFSFLTDAG